MTHSFPTRRSSDLLFLMDYSNHEVKLTLGGDRAQEDLGWSSQPIVAIKCARVSSYNGVSLESVQSSNVKLNPDVPEAHELYNWLQQNGLSGAVSLTVGGERGGGKDIANATTMGRLMHEQI